MTVLEAVAEEPERIAPGHGAMTRRASRPRGEAIESREAAGMSVSVEDQVIEFFASLFEAIFAEPFRAGIGERRKSRAVFRQVDEAADAAAHR